MEKRIEVETRGKNPADIKKLNLDNCRSTYITGFTDEFTNLEVLSLIDVGLVSLKGFPKLPNLKSLDLSGNRISNGLNLLGTSPKLTLLSLGGNEIKDLATLEPLKNFKYLKSLDLFNNEAITGNNYSETVFKMIPSLKYLDGFDKDGVEGGVDSDVDEEVNGNEDDSEEKGPSNEDGSEEKGPSNEDEDENPEEVDAHYTANLDELSDGGDGEAVEEEEDEDGIKEKEEEGGIGEEEEEGGIEEEKEEGGIEEEDEENGTEEDA